MTRAITQDEILRGLDEGIVRLIVDPNMDYGTVAEIGGSWFYFGGMTAEEMTPEEYLRDIPKEDIARDICEVMQEFENEMDYSDEWAFYRAVLDETLGTEV